MPATKIAMSVIACAVVLLAGCEMADQYATFVPKILRQPSTEPPAPEPEPDVKELVRAGADTLFTAHPTAVAVSRPHRMAGRGFSACVKAMVVGPMNPDPQPITLLVTIDHGKFTDRHRATSQDDRTRPTLSETASELGASQREVVAQHVQQWRRRIHVHRVCDAVDGQANWRVHGHDLVFSAVSASNCRPAYQPKATQMAMTANARIDR